MKLSASEFRNEKHKSITLLGMSGVGKTYISRILLKNDWFHYSGDYRIGTCYLNEPILDNIKIQAMQVPFLRDLLRSDSIYINNNITVRNLDPVSTFIGKVGDPKHGGLRLEEFKRRQALHRDAEIRAMYDVPSFIKKSHEIYGFDHFVNDAGGSLCELDDNVIRKLADHTLIIYIKADKDDEESLIERSVKSPKPLYYRSSFLEKMIDVYLKESLLERIDHANPNNFVEWVFPHLFNSRIPRYEDIAKKYGYTIKKKDLDMVNSEDDFLMLVEEALEQ